MPSWRKDQWERHALRKASPTRSAMPFKGSPGAFAAVAALTSSASLLASAYTNPIVIKNYKMFDSNTGDYFAVKGVDYYPRPNSGELNVNNYDFFTDDDSSIWKDDIAYLAEAGANAVRLYAVDPSKSHDDFMCELRKYGMYALVDLGATCENCSSTVDEYPACYPGALKTRGQQIITEFAQYDNTLGFSAGNEINNLVDDAATNALCQKKFIRDMRAFIGGCSSTMRSIPVGVVMADPDTTNNNRQLNAQYYNCRTDSSDKYENAEWYGLNTYQYCDGDVTTLADADGFSELLTDFTNYSMSIPVMQTEYGCAQRTWRQAGWLLGDDFSKVFSGGFAVEYSTEMANSDGSGSSASAYPFTSYGAQNYGLGYYSPEDCDWINTMCSYNPISNFYNLSTQYNDSDFSSESSYDDFTADSDRASPPDCPSGFSALADSTWESDSVEDESCPSERLDHTTSSAASGGTAESSGDSSDASAVSVSMASVLLLGSVIATLL
ncbi:hypothetical protein PHYSODRAFT_331188 [Phytophthora sojae]|uniref:1,3-beta-glucanosyltransferase n=1 Tax=Phytophthora sojae (strain P6497) TaxID=1094619 RepID=G4ZHV1_PHYSP|nr:hypothetical protein PHYSODRAFT_331188 [Phytophthora sojae]EGZ17174.1 hypothetical protein PHYSODRAFT_331188 [Phytophthora sojae]|eukprot:XP_009526232.1 hypothetical protein PHYSODRAFT_331188 [Phytophthora sojae]